MHIHHDPTKCKLVFLAVHDAQPGIALLFFTNLKFIALREHTQGAILESLVNFMEKLKEVMNWILDLEIPYFTVYALSTENINERSEEELEALYDLYVSGLTEISEDPKIHSRRVKVQAVGRLEMLPDRVRESIRIAEDATSEYSDFLFTVCLAYGGREEIVDAVREVAAAHAEGEISLESIDTGQISSRLYTSNLPDPDLVIRTSGEERISNFLLWQIAYSELHFTDVHWPSFTKSDLYEALESFQKRRRKYGK